MPRVPVELYREIVQHVESKNDLRALCVSSKVLQPEAEFFIYQTIKSASLVHTETICRILITTPRVRPFVRHIHITLAFEPSAKYWHLVARVLESLPDLTSLRIFDAKKATNENSWILSRCSFRLRELHCNFVMDDNLSTFLKQQSALEELKWVDGQLDSTYPESQSIDISPKLTKLTTTSPAFALEVMRSHVLTHVFVDAPCAIGLESWTSFFDDIGPNARRLRSLRLHFPYDKRTLATVLVKLAAEASEIRSLGFLPCFNANGREVITAIANFKKLESLVTWGALTAETCHALAEACPSLRLVACLHYSCAYEYVFLPVNPPGVPHAVQDPDSRLWREA